jgi:hypothetical protein
VVKADAFSELLDETIRTFAENARSGRSTQPLPRVLAYRCSLRKETPNS